MIAKSLDNLRLKLYFLHPTQEASRNWFSCSNLLQCAGARLVTALSLIGV